MKHWPALLALAFAGFVARSLLLNLAVQASALHKVAGMLVFALVPIGFLVALVLMLRTVRPSLKTVAGQLSAPAKRGSSLYQVASVLIPFLFVYAAFDYFYDDASLYHYKVWEDSTLANADLFNGGSSHLEDRLVMGLDKTVLISVGIAAVLRWLVGLWRNARGNALVGFANAYLEVIWMSLAAWTFTIAYDELVSNRVAYAWAAEQWKGVIASLGPLSGVGQFLSDALGAADTVIVVPVAWLAVGAIVYGRSIPQGADLLSKPVRRRWLRVPQALRSDVSDSFGPLTRGLRLLKHAGLGTMLLFCLVFLAAQLIPDALWFTERALIGAQDLESLWWWLSAVLGGFNDAVGTVFLICLVAAAVERVLSARAQSGAEGEAGVAGQAQGLLDPQRDRPRIGGRDEESHGLVPV